MSVLVTPFTANEFMLQALIAGILVSIACAIAGTFIILRGLAFIGDALAHGVLPGIALAIIFGFPGIIGAAIGAAFMIGGITLITERSRLSSDTAIGLLFIGMLSLGVVIVSRSNTFTGDLTRILFGEILGIGIPAILVQLVATIVIIAIAVICARPFQLLSFDPEQAEVAGYSRRLYHNVMLFMIATTVIVSFQTVGTLLVFGLLIAPAGAGALLARQIKVMMAWATLFGALSMYLGLLASYYFNLAAGAAIILVAVLIFFIVFIMQNIRQRRAETPGWLIMGINKNTPSLPADKTSDAASGNGNLPRILARHLSVGYAGEIVLADVSFELKRGQAIALIGTNGSGKSTLLKTVVGLLPSMGGELSVFGMPPGNSHTRLAYLGQFHASGFILPLRAIDVVRMGRFPLHGLTGRIGREDDEIVRSAMHTMGIENLADSPLRSLSGGQQQRTYLAQVLAHRADLLVLDEPTTGLDVGGRELYLSAINDEICRGASIIVATHDIQEEAALCDEVILLARRVVAIGTPQEVLTPEALLEAFGIVVASEKGHLHVLECQHGHDDIEHPGITGQGRQL